MPLCCIALLACGGRAPSTDVPAPAPAPGQSNVAISGTLGGRPFVAKSVLAWVNGSDAGANLPETIRMFDVPMTCDELDAFLTAAQSDMPKPERDVILSFPGVDGATIDLSAGAYGINASGDISEFDDNTVTPPVTETSTGGTLTIVKAATIGDYDLPDAGPKSYGHIALTFKAGSDEIAGEADYFLCF